MTVDKDVTSLRIYLQTEVTRCSASISRLNLDTKTFERVRSLPEFTPKIDSDRQGAWRAYISTGTDGWADGLYVLDVEGEGDYAGITYHSAVFIVRREPPTSKGILYKLPTNTWNAYSQLPYDDIGDDPEYCSLYGKRAATGGTVPCYRPGIGIAPAEGFSIFAPEMYGDYRYRPSCLLEGHLLFAPWMYGVGYRDVQYCTDLDLHRAGLDPHRGGDALLVGDRSLRFRLLVCSGHDEYWTCAMRSAVAAFINRGGNVAFLSGNNACGRVDLALEYFGGRPAYSISVDKTKPVPTWWNRPINQLTGMNTNTGGGWFGTVGVSAGQVRNYTWVAPVESWIRFGPDPTELPGEQLTYNEFDTIDYRSDAAPGVAIPAQPPFDLVRLAEVSNITGYSLAPSGLVGDEPSEHVPLRATVCCFQPYGSVVNVGSTEWIGCAPKPDAPSGYPIVLRTTQNILQTLSGDRKLVGIGSFSRETALDILYATTLSRPDCESVPVVGFWALDSSQASFDVERGKWLQNLCGGSQYEVCAFGRSPEGAPLVFLQKGASVAIWRARIFDPTTTPPQESAAAARCFQAEVVSSTELEAPAGERLIGCAKATDSDRLRLVFLASSGLILRELTSFPHYSLGAASGPFPLRGYESVTVGSAHKNGRLVSAFAVMSAAQAQIFSIETGYPGADAHWQPTLIACIAVRNSDPTLRIVGVAACETDSVCSLLVTRDNFSVQVSNTLPVRGDLDLAPNELKTLAMKDGFKHDS